MDNKRKQSLELQLQEVQQEIVTITDPNYFSEVCKAKLKELESTESILQYYIEEESIDI